MMSFPPRPPMGMPPMPPVMQQGYTFTSMNNIGMMPMGINMVPPSTIIRPILTSASVITTQSRPRKTLIPQEIPKDDKKEDKPPVTTVFVGNISDRAPDSMIRTMLQRCGNVLSWKRVQGASGKLQAFGFCEFEDPEATLRCIRLLNDWHIADKKLVVKVDAKTKTLLDEYRAKKKKANGTEGEKKEEKKESTEGDEYKEKEVGDDKEKDKEDKEREEEVDLDEFTKREDRVAKAGLDAIMREYAFELAKEPPQSKESESQKQTQKKKEEIIIRDAGIDDMDMEDDKKEIINREIKSFRDLHKILLNLSGKNLVNTKQRYFIN